MKVPDGFSKKGYFLGPIALVYAWIIILVCQYLDPWWNWDGIHGSALSYMGDPTETAYAWVYNVGMITTGVLIAIFALSIYTVARNRTERLGSAFFVVGGLALVGVGVFHQTPNKSLEIYHEIFSAGFFLLAFLAVVTWGIGLRKEGRKPLGLGMITLAVGALGAWGGLQLALYEAKNHPNWLAYYQAVQYLFTGATGEVFGILAIDVWVVLMFFARESSPRTLPTPFPAGVLGAGETLKLEARPSLLHAIQVRGILYVSLGLFLFGFSDYFLTNNLPTLILNGTSAILTVLEVTLGTALAGYILLLVGVWRWSRVLPRPIAYALFSLSLVLPPIFFVDWFSASGNEGLLSFFLAVGLIVPLTLSLLLWWRTRYALTDQRVLTSTRPFTFSSMALPTGQVQAAALDQGWVQRRAEVGDVVFLRDPVSSLAPGESRDRVEWRGVSRPRKTLAEAREVLGAAEVRSRRSRRHVRLFLVVLALVTAVVLILTLIPVFQVTDTMEMNCALDLSNLTALESNPWPFLHNVTLPPGHVSFHWWTGTPVWFGVIMLPQGIAYQNVEISSLNISNLNKLTSNGTGSVTSYGGTALAGCIATTEGASATLVLSYGSPLVWV